MENKLMIFENETFGKVRTLTIGGEAWFVAADVCKALDLGNPSMTVERLDDDEKGISTIDTLGGKQRMATRIKPSTPERSATPCRKAASASGSRSATSGAGPPANAPKTPDIRRPQGVYTPKTNKNRAPAQESLPLRGRCHFRGKQPMK